MGAAKTILITLGIAILLFGAIGGYYAYSFTKGPEPALLDEVSGNVEVERAGSLIPATQGMKLEQGDKIRTRQGEASIILFGGSYVRLDTESEIELTTLDENTADVAVKLNSGEIWNRIVRATDDPALSAIASIKGLRSYSVDMADAVATVRGTGFGCSRRGPSTVSVVHGTVGFRSGTLEQPVSSRTATIRDGAIQQRDLERTPFIQRSIEKDRARDLLILAQIRERYGRVIDYVRSQYGWTDAEIDQAILDYLAAGGGEVPDDAERAAREAGELPPEEGTPRSVSEAGIGERVEGGGVIVGEQRGACGVRLCECGGGAVTKKSSKSKTVASSDASASNCPALQMGGEGLLTGEHRGASWTARWKGSSVTCYGESTISAEGSATVEYGGQSQKVDYCEPETFDQTCAETVKACDDAKAAAEADAQAKADQDAAEGLSAQEESALGAAQNAREACLDKVCRGG